MGLFEKTRKLRKVGKDLAGKTIQLKTNKPEAPDGIYTKCKECEQTIRKEDVAKNYYTCPQCGHSFRLRAQERIKMICDSFIEFTTSLETIDPLKMPEYKDKIVLAQKETGLSDAVATGFANIHGQKCVLFVMDPNFMMASMGSVVGEKITRAFEIAQNKNLPVVGFSASGGARMQEGMFSLMQMAKTSAAIGRFSKDGGLYINVLTYPTTGGVTASFAMLADITLAEPKALIGFAGPRVIEQTIRQKLPAGFQTAEFVQEHGFVDRIVERRDQREVLAKLIAMHTGKRK